MNTSRDGERAALPTSDDRAPLQRQARALGNPTRFALFEHVARLHRPVQVATLVEQFGLNHNVIRQHLAKLCEAGLFVEEFAPRSGPGRPALQYRLAPDVAATWGLSSPYEQLALLLLEMTAERLSPREVGRRAGRRAATAGADAPAIPLERLVREMRKIGFDLQTRESSAAVELLLDPSPLAAGVAEHREILCELHRGFAEGFLREVGSELRVVDLQADDRAGGSCAIRLETERATTS